MQVPELSTIADYIDWAEAQFRSADLIFGHGCTCARDEAIWATLHAVKLMDRELEEVTEYPVSVSQGIYIRALVETRIQTRQPLAYLLNEACFAGQAFYIDERAIIPRSHIGDLIQDGLEPWVQHDEVKRILDLCTGSGCIAIALALMFPAAEVIATDIDSDCLQVAEINIQRFQLSGQIRVVQSDLFQNLAGERFDLIVSNPPYVDSNIIDDLPIEYRHEPRIAFEAEDNGLEFVKKIISESRDYLTSCGTLILEAGDSAHTLDAAYPDIPFLWLTSRSGESVTLVMTASELDLYRKKIL